jgi:DNA invertase Pin-like site-specific DNA recombinase
MSGKGAYAYTRVSSVGQVDGHGYERQDAAIAEYAKRHGCRIVETFRDAHTGTEAERPGFASMLAAIKGNGTRTVIIERLDRFARELGTQIALLGLLQREGVSLIEATTGRDVTAALNDDPMAKAMVSIQGVFHQVEKELLVRKLAKARAAVRERDGHCEGPRAYGQDPARPDEAATCKRIAELRRRVPSKRRMTLAAVAAVLNAEQRPSRSGRPWNAAMVRDVAS